MNCKICGRWNEKCFSSKILNKYNINYFHCSLCDFIQTEEPFWLPEAYAHSINKTDTGYMVRNNFYAKRMTIFLYFLFTTKGKFLDYAGGYGVFVRLMRDIGFDFWWEDKHTVNLFSLGFERNQADRYSAVTLFEVFEHFEDPMNEIEKLLNISDVIIFSTELHPNPVPQPSDWWYYGLDHGQHISFYSRKTFEYIAQKMKLNYLNLGSLHVLSRIKIAPWKLSITKLSKFGLHKLISRKLTSKTWSDYEVMLKKERR